MRVKHQLGGHYPGLILGNWSLERGQWTLTEPRGDIHGEWPWPAS